MRDDGIQVGEITGWHVWKTTWREGRWMLESLNRGYIYSAEPFNGGKPQYSWYHGVWYSNTRRLALKTAFPPEIFALIFVLPLILAGPILIGILISASHKIGGALIALLLIGLMCTIVFVVLHGVMVIGRVRLWGEVITHEKGGRAEYAQVVAIDHVYCCPIANHFIRRALRRTYLKGE